MKNRFLSVGMMFFFGLSSFVQAEPIIIDYSSCYRDQVVALFNQNLFQIIPAGSDEIEIFSAQQCQELFEIRLDYGIEADSRALFSSTFVKKIMLDQDKVIGFIMVAASLCAEPLVVDTLVITRDAQRRGYGTVLLNCAVSEASQDTQYKDVVVPVTADNIAAQAFFKKNGFVVSAEDTQKANLEMVEMLKAGFDSAKVLLDLPLNCMQTLVYKKSLDRSVN